MCAYRGAMARAYDGSRPGRVDRARVAAYNADTGTKGSRPDGSHRRTVPGLMWALDGWT